jgi:hypothetical protein
MHIPTVGKFVFARVAAIALVLGAFAAQAQSYPERSIKMVIPFPPAGVTDIVARTMAAKLTDELGQTVVAENRAGASGAIGAEVVARAPADGYTWVMGNISTMAGTGTAGFTGDGQPATAAQIYNPIAIALDGSGNVYFSDYNNWRIRKVDTTGIISTIVGNGTRLYNGDTNYTYLASLYNPLGVAADNSGNVYIAEYNHHRVRKVTAATGIINVFAGTGTASSTGDSGQATSATITAPSGVAVDASLNVYIAESAGYRIRKVTTDGKIATVAGTGTLGFSGDGGRATSANLNTPYGVTVDPSGNIYITQLTDNRTRKVTTDGNITTIAGNGGGSSYSGDYMQATSASFNLSFGSSNVGGVAADASGNVYIADSTNHRVRKVTAATGIVTTVAGNGVGNYYGDSTTTALTVSPQRSSGTPMTAASTTAGWASSAFSTSAG